MALGDKNDEYGGIGRNGAQQMVTKELDKKELRLREAGEAYAFGPRLFNLEADAFIKKYSDVTCMFGPMGPFRQSPSYTLPARRIAAAQALIRWRFEPNLYEKVKVPITFAP